VLAASEVWSLQRPLDDSQRSTSDVQIIQRVREQRRTSFSQCRLIVAMSGDCHGDTVPAGILADSFYPKGRYPSNLLTTVANLIATNLTRRRQETLDARPLMTRSAAAE
jgi:hypothetical protein